MEPKKPKDIFNVRKTDESFLEQVNEYEKQAIDIQKRTLGNVPKRRPTAIETFIERHIADIKKCDDEIASVLVSQQSRGYSNVRQSMLTKRFENLSNIVEIMKAEHAKSKYDNASVSAIKEQVDVIQNAHKELSRNLKKLSDSASNVIRLIQEQKELKKEIHELKKEKLRLHYGREKTSNKNTVAADNDKKIVIMEAKVSKNDINIKSFRSGEKVEELNRGVESSLNKFAREIDELETKIGSARYKTPDKGSEVGKFVPTIVKKVKELVKSLKNTLAELRNKMAELGEKTKHDQDKNLQADKLTLNTHQGKISSEKKQGMRSEDNIIDSTEIRYLTKRSKELLTRAELIGLERDSGEYSEIGIDILKKQIKAVQDVGKKLSYNLKELSNLPANTSQLIKEQISLRTELNKLKRENRTLDKLEKGEKVSKSIIDNRREANSKKITTIEAKVSKNDTEMKSLSTEGKIRELNENIKNSLIDFKREVARLETRVKSLEKGRAPKPPQQIASELSETVIKSFKDVKGYLHTLTKDVNNHGVYKGSKEYLQKVVNYLNDSCIMESDKLQKLETDLDKPNLTKEQFTQITTALVNIIDSSKIDNFDNREQKIVGDHTQRLVEGRESNKEKKQINL